MKKTFIILLKLQHPENTYSDLSNYLKTASTWAKPLPNVWIIKASNTAANIRDGIKQHIHSADKVLVINIKANGWGSRNYDKVLTDWLHKNLS